MSTFLQQFTIVSLVTLRQARTNIYNDSFMSGKAYSLVASNSSKTLLTSSFL